MSKIKIIILTLFIKFYGFCDEFSEQFIRSSKYNFGNILPVKSIDFELKGSQSKGITLEQLLAFTRGLLSSDVVETSFKIADRNKDGLLNNEESQQASVIANALAQYRVQEQLTEAEKTQDGLIELDEAKLIAQRVGLEGADNELASHADKDGLLTSENVEQVINTNANKTPIHATFDKFDENFDGRWSDSEAEKFINVMDIDRLKWSQALQFAQLNTDFDNGINFNDFQRAMQYYS